MSISSIIVGGQGCSISKLISALRSSSSFHLFHDKFSDVAIDLETPMELIKKLRQDKLLDKLTLVGVVSSLVEDWVARNGSKATLKELVGILDENGLRACSESVEKAFTDPDISPTAYQKYSRIPPGLNDFLSESNILKTICIIPTPDVPITCDKLRENLKDCIIHEYEDFLKIISVPTSGTQNPYYVSIGSLKQIKKVLTGIIDQPGKKIRLIVVTPKDSQEDLIELLHSHPNWGHTIQICIDTIEWNDLTLAHQNKIEKALRERFHVDFDENEEFNEGLNDKILVDLIHGNKFQLFKDTLPAELNYYVYRTMITRNYISQSIFDEASPDIFLFKGVKRYELTRFVKNKSTDNSTSQIRQKVVKVKHIILDHHSHFEKICAKTSAPVHLLHFKDGRFNWLKSRKGVSVLQKNLAESQVTMREEMFYKNLSTENNFPIIIADSPGMGKSVLLAKIGNHLASIYPTGGTVFFILVAEFMRKIKDAGIEEYVEGVKTCLHNLLCENVVGRIILNSKLNSTEGVVIELLMDGFDELNPNDSKLALEVLRTILESFKSIRLWVTSRQHLLFDLENTMDTLGYNIQPFDEEDQIQFLTSFWSPNTKGHERRLKMYVKECLKVLKSNMNSKQQDIAGVPLQCLLIGEVYEEDAITYSDSEVDSFPTITVSTITDLYASTVAKKIRKYREVLKMNDRSQPIDDDTLMNMHVCISLKLIFPEHTRILQHLFDPVQLEDILKVGILESSSLTTNPRFIHRTFAEYFIAWYFVNQFGSEEVTDILFEGVFSCHDSFSNSVGVDSFVFANPVVCYFIDSMITEDTTVNISDTPSISNVIKSADNMHKIAHSCVNADLTQLFKFFCRMNMFEMHEQSIFNKDLLLLAIEKSSVEFVKLVLGLLEKHQSLDLKIQEASLCAAVRRGEYAIVEHLINERELCLVTEDIAEGFRTVLHDCVTDSINNSQNIIEQKLEVIRLIISINPMLMEELNVDGQTPLLSKRVNVHLMMELISLGANVLAKDLNHDTVLHLRPDGRNLACEDFYLLLSNIPQDKLNMLVRMKGKQDHTPLASLIELKNPTPETLAKFLHAGADFNCLDKTGSSILETAIRNGRNGETLRKLVKCGAKVVSWRGQNGETVLHVAASFGNLEATLFFLSDDQNMDVNVNDVNGFTPLDYVLKSKLEHGNRIETGRALHEAGGKFKETFNSSRETWFHLSAQNGNIQSIQLLRNIGMDVNISDEEGNTPLHSLLTTWNSTKTPVLELLIDHDANPSLLNKNGHTPFHLGLLSDHLDIQTFKLLKSTTILDWTTYLANLSLQNLIVNGDELTDDDFIGIAKEIEDQGADFVFQDDQGNSLLHNAIIHMHTKAIHLLLKKQCDMNLRNNWQQTPLHLAAEKELGWEVIKLLIENGSDVEAKDKNNATFLHVFMLKNPTITDFHSLVKYLATKNLGKLFNVHGGLKQVTPFQLAVAKLELDKDTLLLLKSSGVDFNAKDNKGKSVLGYAVEGKRGLEFLFYMILHGADWKTLTNHKSSMLHLAAQYGTPESLKFILTLSLDVNGVDGDGDTPLHCVAAQRGKQGILEKYKLLVENGADVNILNDKGYTPLQYALMVRTDDIYEVLRCLITENNLNSNIFLIDKDHSRISLETIKRLTDTSERDKDNCTILHKFVLQSGTPTAAEFHSVSEYLVGKNLSHLLNSHGGKFGATPFQEAVRVLEPNAATLSLLHSNGVHFNSVDNNGDSLLFYAVQGKRSTEFLANSTMEFGADVTHLNSHGDSLLHSAVTDGTSEAVKFYIDLKNLNVNEKNTIGLSPLHALVKSVKGTFEEEAITKYRLLVDKGADVNSRDNLQNTPLHSSAHNGRKDVSLKIIKHLVKDGADLYAKGSFNFSFLHYYINRQPCPTPSEFDDIVIFLKEEGCIDIFNETDESGRTPMLYAVGLLEPAENTLSTLHSNGINFNTIDILGNTLLNTALWGGRSEHFMSMLITRFGVSPKNINSHGVDLLHKLVFNYSVDSLKHFLDLSLPGLDLNGRNKNGFTPLHYNIQYGAEDVPQKCKLLVSYGADVNSRCNNQQTPLHKAVMCIDKETTLKTVKFLIEQGADIFAKDMHDQTFLHLYFKDKITAPNSSQLHSLVELLISKDFADVFNTPCGEVEETPLHLIVQFLEPELRTLSLLHSRGINFNAVDKHGGSIMSRAVWGRQGTEVLSHLGNKLGAKHNCLTNDGASILHTAAYFGTVESLKFFADLDDLDTNGRTTDEYGNTPLICTVYPNSRKVDVLEKCKLLLSKGADVTISNNKGQTALSIVMESYDGQDKNELITLLQASSNKGQVPRSPPTNTSEPALPAKKRPRQN